MKRSIVAVNNGSASHKYALYTDEVLVHKAHYERTEDGFARTLDGVTIPIDGGVFSSSREDFFRIITEKGIHVDGVGVRAVAPGSFFCEHRIVDATYIEALERAALYDPAHTRPVLELLSTLLREMPDTPIVAVSDSAFHTSMPAVARELALPASLIAEHDLHRFGYHGISMSALAREFPTGRVIICHLGSGASITAVRDGKSIDTTMGYSPLQGLIMSSRIGDIDPAVVTLLASRKSPEQLVSLFYKESGLKALSGLSDDMRVLLAEESRNAAAAHAIEAFVYRIVSYIGAYVAVLGGLDTLVFSGTIGERSAAIRRKISERLGVFGVVIDTDKNDHAHAGDNIQTGAVTICVRHTDETAEVARAAGEVVGHMVTLKKEETIA